MTVKLRVKNDQYETYDLHLGNFVLSVTHLNPTKHTNGHKHDYEEAYYFAQGYGRVKLGRRIMNVNSGDFIRVPPNTFHLVYNDSDSQLLAFVCAFCGEVKKRSKQ